MGKVLKVLAVMGLTAIIFGIAVIALVASSCSDSPTHDSREVRAFINDPKVTDRDLATFDALRGCIESMHDTLALNIARNGDDGTGEETHRKLITVDELSQELEHGSWPGKKSGFGTTSTSHNPQLWVRIAELSEDQIEKATGEDWQVVDFAYPFPHGGAAPVPATRDENDKVRTLLVCRSGNDAGLYATVRYWRWAYPAHFEVCVDEARAGHVALVKTRQTLGAASALEGRQFLYDGANVAIWELEGDDPLHDPAAFVGLINECAPLLDSSATFSLVRHDTPVALRWNDYSPDYPNKREVESLSFEEGQDQLLYSHGHRYFDCAEADVLLSAHCGPQDTCNESKLSGELAPAGARRTEVRWDRPSYGCLFDDTLEELARKRLGCSDEQPMIAVSSLVSRGEKSEDTDLYAWVIVPRGAFSETPEAFCSEVNGLRDELWNVAVDSPKGEQKRNLYLRVVVIDGEGIVRKTDEGGIPCSFVELAQAMHADMGCLDEYEFEVMLTGESSLRQWHEEWRLNRFDCERDNVQGTLAQSRAWRYGS